MQNIWVAVVAVAAVALGAWWFVSQGDSAGGDVPRIASIEFPSQIPADGSMAVGVVRFNAKQRVTMAEFDVVNADFFSPFGFDPESPDGVDAFTFAVSTVVPQRVTLKLTLVDENGQRSKPKEFSFMAVQVQEGP